ncbi:phage major capsid protein, partial [Lysinibacillus capsici]|uniref:phage major capsid protein n=1 Tax=Lysinibacillus capsici TaxID=2115968 RepID=UPI000E2030A8
IADEIKDQELNTKNAAIAAVLKTATAKAVTGIDGLKGVFNKDLKRVYKGKAIISASLFNALDTTKDKNGRYLLQDDITVESGKKLFGKEVIVLDDDMIGTSTGDLVGFIGDPKAFATLFDRKQVSVKWVDNEVYGQLLAGYVRFDAKAVDTEAGFYITYTPEVAGA